MVVVLKFSVIFPLNLCSGSEVSRNNGAGIRALEPGLIQSHPPDLPGWALIATSPPDLPLLTLTLRLLLLLCSLPLAGAWVPVQEGQ